VDRIGKVGAGVLAAGIVAVGSSVGAGTANAAVDPWYVLTGNFAGDARDEAFIYVPGTHEDGLGANFVYEGEDVVWEESSFTVNGFYDPVTGDFDGDGFDEILWYGIGTAADFLWSFTSLSTVQSSLYTANGVYDPVSGDFTGDGVDDVLWYAPGPAQDYLWDFNSGGAFTSQPRTINGRYRPIVGSFGTDDTDDIFWYAPGSAADFLWDFVQGTTAFTSTLFAVSGTYRPLSGDFFGDGFGGGDDIFWYSPGPGAEAMWDFVDGQRTNVAADPVNGTYIANTGDFLGDDHDDVLFTTSNGTAVLWDFQATGGAATTSVSG
jgi:hypothetical protein